MGWDSRADEMLELDRRHVWHPVTQHGAFQQGEASPIVMVSGEGSTVTDQEGRSYLDAAAGIWCVNVGYGREELVSAAVRQLRELAYYPLTQSHPAAIRLGAKLAGHLPATPHFYFSNSGSEANETAFKMVRQYWRLRGKSRKVKILSRHRGYHGTTMGALAAGGQDERKRDYEPLVPGFVQVAAPYCWRCPFGLSYPSCGLQCARDFERRIQIEGPDTVAAIVVEPVTAGGGVIVPPADYLGAVAAIARAYDVKLIVDEVVTGFGRTGTMFGYQHDPKVVPDIVTMAKGLTSGYMPMGATAVSDEMFDAFLGPAGSGRHLRHINTFAGHPVAAAVALANIEVIERDKLVDLSRHSGAALLAALGEQVGGYAGVGEIRGQGLLAGIELVDPGTSRQPVSDAVMQAVVGGLRRLGVLVGKTTDLAQNENNVLMFAPPLIIRPEEIDRLAGATRKVLEDVGLA